MFHGTGVNSKINHFDERSLRIVYKDNNSSFGKLLQKDNSFTVHHRKSQSLAIELFKIKGDLSNTVMNDRLQTKTLPYLITDREKGRRQVLQGILSRLVLLA